MTRQNGFHEDYQQSNEVRAGSDRAFGIVFAIVFTIVGAWPLLGDAPLRLWALGLAGVFLATALIAPNILKPLNQVWFRFGMLLHKVVWLTFGDGSTIVPLVGSPKQMYQRLHAQHNVKFAFPTVRDLLNNSKPKITDKD